MLIMLCFLAMGLTPVIFVIICLIVLTAQAVIGFIMEQYNKKYLRGIIGLALVALIVLDFVLTVVFGESGTISQVLLNWSQEQPFISFLFGFVMGHIFWKNESKK